MTNTTKNYNGASFSIPRSADALEVLIRNPNSDECLFTHADLTACGAPPPAGTEDHKFVIAMGDLCAYAPGSSTVKHVWDPADRQWESV